jgi:benzil reductase ((S)-benzoin forming)
MERLLIVTGASSGIGAGLVEAAAGVATVASVSRRPGPGIHLQADLADPGSWTGVNAWVARLVATRDWDWVGLVHCAATIHPTGFAGEVDTDEYVHNVVLNSAAPQVIGHGYLEAMVESGASGCLCLISSGAASTAYPGWSSYCAGKAAVDQWCRTVGAEQEERGGRIRVMSVAPGVVDTDMQTRIRAEPVERFPGVARFHALEKEGRLQDPIQVGRRLWELIDRTDLANGAVLDLRTIDLPSLS